MNITAIRFRTEGSLVVLQVQEAKDNSYGYGGYSGEKSTWRDAQVQDLLDVAQFTASGIDGLGRRVEMLEMRKAPMPVFRGYEKATS